LLSHIIVDNIKFYFNNHAGWELNQYQYSHPVMINW
jgi:hypothetical protein